MAMDMITAWLAEKGIKLSEQAVKNALDITSKEVILQAEMEEISNKLDLIIRAPYKEALMYLREGKFDKCSDKAHEAIALDELDVPARLLYIKLLCMDQQYRSALEYYWDLLDGFGFRGDWVPPVLFKAYTNSYFSEKLTLINFVNISTEDNYYPENLTCSRTAIASNWKRKNAIWRFEFFDSYLMNICRWNGEAILRLDGKNYVWKLSNRYVVVQTPTWEYWVYRLSDGLRVMTPCSKNAIDLFNVPEQFVAYINKCESDAASFNFLGTTIRKSEYEYESLESFWNSSDERMDEGTVKHKGGTVSIEPA